MNNFNNQEKNIDVKASINNKKYDLKEEDLSFNMKNDRDTRKSISSKNINNKETNNNMESNQRKILKENKTERNLIRNKTPFIKEKETYLNRSSLNNNNLNTPIKYKKNADLINKDDELKNGISTNNENNRKSIKKTKPNETTNGKANPHSEGKSLTKQKSEKVVVANFNQADNTNRMENTINKDKSKKIIKNEKTEIYLKTNSSKDITKLKQSQKSFKENENSTKNVLENNIEFSENEDDNNESLKNENVLESRTNSNDLKILNQDSMRIKINDKKTDNNLIKAPIKKIVLYFKKLKKELFTNISKYSIYKNSIFLI